MRAAMRDRIRNRTRDGTATGPANRPGTAGPRRRGRGEDAPDVAPQTARVTLIENPGNRGFIRSVNAGFEVALARGDHVVLLNSDALVPRNWARRLIAPILSDPTVATVTPMSNDAEIFGAPALCLRTVLEPGRNADCGRIAGSGPAAIDGSTAVGVPTVADRIDAVARGFVSGDAAVGGAVGGAVKGGPAGCRPAPGWPRRPPASGSAWR